jgi:hypothetical protein
VPEESKILKGYWMVKPDFGIFQPLISAIPDHLTHVFCELFETGLPRFPERSYGILFNRQNVSLFFSDQKSPFRKLLFTYTS